MFSSGITSPFATSFNFRLRPLVGSTFTSAARAATSGSTSSLTTHDIRDLSERISELRTSLSQLQSPIRGIGQGTESSVHINAAIARSTSDIGLQSRAATNAELTSTEEVNATPTSFTPFGPNFSGDSTSLVTVDGVYDGRNGTDTLTFTVTRDGTVGSSRRLEIDVRDSNGDRVEKIKLNDYREDGVYKMKNGLRISLSAGELERNDTFQVQVFDNVGSVVDPNLSFNGVRNNNPNLEFGNSVNAGSFEINNTVIDVDADDSINSVIDKINNSAAGVTARFDVGSERIVLTQNRAGASATIDIDNDTSGFVEATKLDSASVTPGQDALIDRQTAMRDVAAFSNVRSGDIDINGTTIAIDVRNDSIDDVVARINDSGAGVQASFDARGQRITIVSTTERENIVIDSGRTRLFPGVKIDDATYEYTETITEGTKTVLGLSVADSEKVVRQLNELGTALNRFQSTLTRLGNEDDPLVQSIRTELTSAMTTSFGATGPHFRSRLGINVDLSNDATRAMDLTGRSGRLLRQQLTNNPHDLNRLLTGDGTEKSPGLVNALDSILERAQSEISNTMGPGSFLDFYA